MKKGNEVNVFVCISYLSIDFRIHSLTDKVFALLPFNCFSITSFTLSRTSNCRKHFINIEKWIFFPRITAFGIRLTRFLSSFACISAKNIQVKTTRKGTAKTVSLVIFNVISFGMMRSHHFTELRRFSLRLSFSFFEHQKWIRWQPFANRTIFFACRTKESQNELEKKEKTNHLRLNRVNKSDGNEMEKDECGRSWFQSDLQTFFSRHIQRATQLK